MISALLHRNKINQSFLVGAAFITGLRAQYPTFFGPTARNAAGTELDVLPLLFGIFIDGVNPVNSGTHSTWPFTIVCYNLPPEAS